MTADDCPRPGVTLEAVAALKAAFRPDGMATAGNACPLNDSAAAMVIMSDVEARQLGLTLLAHVVSTALSALSPEIMGLGPAEASTRALARVGLTIGDLDLVAMNEAFAAQVIPAARQLEIDEERLNIYGGAIAIGHPFGMTGVRIATTLIHVLQERDGEFGLETMCVGGGQGMAMVLQHCSEPRSAKQADKTAQSKGRDPVHKPSLEDLISSAGGPRTCCARHLRPRGRRPPSCRPRRSFRRSRRSSPYGSARRGRGGSPSLCSTRPTTCKAYSWRDRTRSGY